MCLTSHACNIRPYVRDHHKRIMSKSRIELLLDEVTYVFDRYDNFWAPRRHNSMRLEARAQYGISLAEKYSQVRTDRLHAEVVCVQGICRQVVYAQGIYRQLAGG